MEYIPALRAFPFGCTPFPGLRPGPGVWTFLGRINASRSDDSTHRRGFQPTFSGQKAGFRRVASVDGPGDFNPLTPNGISDRIQFRVYARKPHIPPRTFSAGDAHPGFGYTRTRFPFHRVPL